jgi:hypothetical protein
MAWGVLAGALVFGFGLFCAYDAPLFLEPATAQKHHISASERPAGVTAASVMARQQVAIEHMRADYPQLSEVSVLWIPCGEENSFYDRFNHQVTLCAELAEHPDAAIQFALHEFGHAVTDQLADVTDENAADELAILAMVRHGYLREMLGSAIYMLENWPLDHQSGDEHPGAAFRAWELACSESAADDYDSAPEECEALLDGLAAKWDRRIPRVPLLMPPPKEAE